MPAGSTIMTLAEELLLAYLDYISLTNQGSKRVAESLI